MTRKKIVTLCGAGVGTSGILKVNAERVLARLDIEAEVIATDLANLARVSAHAQVILVSTELVSRVGRTGADVIAITNYLDLAELERALRRALV